jgi:hypothetical protein
MVSLTIRTLKFEEYTCRIESRPDKGPQEVCSFRFSEVPLIDSTRDDIFRNGMRPVVRGLLRRLSARVIRAKIVLHHL